MDLGLKGKKALVTGSTDGIGFAIAKGLAGEGATVYINGRAEQRVQEAIKKIGSKNGKVLPAPFDLSTRKGADEIIKNIPTLDILVNNLGIYETKDFEKITDEDWYHIFEVNVMSGVRLSRYYLPKMKEQNWGRIVFISSESAVQIPTEMIHYGFTKTAQLAISRGLAETTAGTNVTVNSVLPGPTYSSGVKNFIEDMAKKKGKTTQELEKEFFSNVRPSSLIKRFATTEEVAAMVTYICSTQSSATNGAALRVDGGVIRSII
jgi:NAD(P)-dependent dehydrogenase (short-subunit alcohol dehydrogenase family)